ncbi:MAG: DUF4446 family protein [Armatimonadetes bacterium]|nr:DUF4446 family protein [Armatimonadota bacterium]
MPDVLMWAPLGLSVVALVVAGLAYWQARQAKALATPTPEMQRLEAHLAGPEGGQLLAQLLSQAQAQEGRLRELEAAREQIRNQLRGAVQRVGLKRFNAEEGVGGNLSFALALLDARNHGMMITSMYSLQSCRVFLRGIVNGKAEMPLTEEEQEALEMALGG